MKRILMLGLVLALLAAMVISTAAFAGGYGPGPGDGDGICECQGDCQCDCTPNEYLGPGPHGDESNSTQTREQFRAGQ